MNIELLTVEIPFSGIEALDIQVTNGTIPETPASIITKLGGSAGKIGAGVLPDALSGVGSPVGPSPSTSASAIISFLTTNNGFSFTIGSELFSFGSIGSNQISNAASAAAVINSRTACLVTATSGILLGVPGIQITSKIAGAITPQIAILVGIGMSVAGGGASTAGGSNEIAGTVASFIGQEYHDITDPNNVIVWFHNGTFWQLAGGAATSTDILSALSALTSGEINTLRTILTSASVALNPLP